jgi:hypothetical protein
VYEARVGPEPFITLKIPLMVFKHYLYLVYVMLITIHHDFISEKYKKPLALSTLFGAHGLLPPRRCPLNQLSSGQTSSFWRSCMVCTLEGDRHRPYQPYYTIHRTNCISNVVDHCLHFPWGSNETCGNEEIKRDGGLDPSPSS